MTERKRNLAVGITVLLALCGLGGMIVLFGDVPAFARTGYPLRLHYPVANGISPGGEVRLNGIRVGSVVRVQLHDDPGRGVQVDCRIDRSFRIPGNVAASIGSRGLGGAAFVDLTARAPGPGAPPPQWLPTDGTAELVGVIYPYGGLLGTEVSDELTRIAASFESFSRLAENLNRILTAERAPTPATGAATTPATGPGEGLAGTISRLNRVLDGFESVVSDPENRQNIKATLANLRQATDQATTAVAELHSFAQDAREGLAAFNRNSDAVSQRVVELSQRLTEDAVRLGKLLTTLDRATEKLAAGEGTAGKLLNDPVLYNQLVESMRQLARTLEELQTTLRTWREEGVDIDVW